jgi:hypothetical protein
MMSNYLNQNVTETGTLEQGSGTLLSPFQRKLLLKNLEEDLRPEFSRGASHFGRSKFSERIILKTKTLYLRE